MDHRCNPLCADGFHAILFRAPAGETNAWQTANAIGLAALSMVGMLPAMSNQASMTIAGPGAAYKQTGYVAWGVLSGGEQ